MTGSSYRFGVLGPLLVERDGEVVSVSSGHQRALLAALLAGEGPLSRDRLIDELWGENCPPSATKALSVHLSRLRSQIGDVIVHRAGGYRLEAGDFELDAAAFARLVGRARSEPERSRELLNRALGLFRGEPLADVDSDGIVQRWRRTLLQERREATVARIDLDLAAGAGPELVGELEALLDEHPYEERIWGQLMRALQRSGRTADALDAYDRARRLFAYELGLEPGAALSRLQASILRGEDDGASRGAAPTLPKPLGRLFGRDEELLSLASVVSEREVRLLTLVGPGGVGKTRLAVELAHRLSEQFSHGSLLVTLDQLRDARAVLPAIAAALGRHDGTAPPASDRLTETVGARRILFVLDNFEHVLEAAPAVAALLASTPAVAVIATSRAPLRVRGERVHEVRPLVLPRGDSEDDVRLSPAVQLFLELGSAVDDRLHEAPDLLGDAVEICRRLEGLPLAIELAAAQLRALTPAEMSASLEAPLEFGAQGPRDLPHRQRTLADTIRWSVDLLDPAAREAFLAACIFRGGFTRPALEAVLGRTASGELRDLVDASLLRRELARERFGMLELVRTFGLAELADSGGLELYRQRHRAYFADLAAPVGALLDDGDAPEGLADRLGPDHANLRAALDDAFAAGDQRCALALVRGMRSLWYAGWLREEGLEAIQRLLEAFDVAPDEELVLLRAGSLLESGDLDPAAPLTYTRRLEHRAAAIGDEAARSVAVANLASHAMNSQDRDEMVRIKPRLQELAKADLPVPYGAMVLYSLAQIAYADGDLEGAQRWLEDGIAQARSVDHAYMSAAGLTSRLIVVSAREERMSARDLAEVLAAARGVGVRPLTLVALWLAARYAAAVDPVAAQRLLVHAERVFLSLDTRMWPESEIRDQTLVVLKLERLEPGTERADPPGALQMAHEWLAGRPKDEVVTWSR